MSTALERLENLSVTIRTTASYFTSTSDHIFAMSHFRHHSSENLEQAKGRLMRKIGVEDQERSIKNNGSC